MKPINTLLAILFISLSSPSWSMTLGDLVERDGLYYEKFTDVPFSGEVTGGEQGSFESGKKEGAWISYWDNGQLEAKGNYENGKLEGAFVRYWDNGQLRSKGNYKDGKKEGAWVGYNEDGTVDKESTGTYKNNVKISDWSLSKLIKG